MGVETIALKRTQTVPNLGNDDDRRVTPLLPLHGVEMGVVVDLLAAQPGEVAGAGLRRVRVSRPGLADPQE